MVASLAEVVRGCNRLARGLRGEAGVAHSDGRFLAGGRVRAEFGVGGIHDSQDSARVVQAAPRRISASSLAASLRSRALAVLAQCLPLALLLARHFRFDAADAQWADRDRLVLAPELAVLGEAARGLLGAAAMFALPAGVFGTASGLALAERMMAARYGRSLVDHRSWVFAGGDMLSTGASAEAAWLAGAWRLGRLTAVVTVSARHAQGLACFSANGWSVRRVRAAEGGEIASAMSAALRSVRPSLIACVLGVEDPAMRDDAAAGEAAEREALAAGLAWAAAGRRAAGVRRAWLKRLARHAGRGDYDAAMNGRLPASWHAALSEPERLLPEGATLLSTAAAAGQAFARVAGGMPDLASLPGRAGASLPAAQPEPASPLDAVASGLVLGVTGAMCGLGLHGGQLAYAMHRLEDLAGVQTALQDAARLGARMVELLIEPADTGVIAGHRASLRAMDNLVVFRPADASETYECVELALRRTSGPAVLLVSALAVPLLAARPARTRSARGGYVVVEPATARAASLVASGADLHLALAAQRLLAEAGVPAAVVSLPCWDLFAAAEPAWRARVLGTAPCFGLESGSGFGWERWLGGQGAFIDTRPEPGMAGGVSDSARRVARMVRRHLAGGGDAGRD
jgi:transketolase